MSNFKYQKEHVEFCKTHYSDCCSYEEFAEKFNSEFGTEKSANALQQFLTKKLGFYIITEKLKTHYTKEQEEWILQNYKTANGLDDLTKMFNKKFGTERTKTQISDKCSKGMGLNGIPNKTTYRKGNEKEQCPIGTIRKSSNGATYIKAKDSKLSFQSGYREPYWIPIQKKIWQEHYGKVSSGKMVIFLDGNHENLDIENLYCIDRKISAVMAKNRWFTSSREHTLTAIKWCELYYSMKARS